MAPVSGPLFKQLARSIGDQIDGDEIAIGDLLPTEAELSRRHGVSRHTVREALAELRARGLIESRQGIGSIVVRRGASSAYTESYSSIEELTRFAKGTPIHAKSVDDLIADETLAKALRGKVGQSYVRLSGVRFDREDEGSPVGHVEAYVHGTYGGIRERMWNLTSSVAETIEQMYGITIARIEQEIGVELLTVEQSEMLGVAPDTPALTIRRWYSAENGRIFEVAFSRYPMGRFAYRNVLMRQSRNG